MQQAQEADLQSQPLAQQLAVLEDMVANGQPSSSSQLAASLETPSWAPQLQQLAFQEQLEALGRIERLSPGSVPRLATKLAPAWRLQLLAAPLSQQLSALQGLQQLHRPTAELLASDLVLAWAEALPSAELQHQLEALHLAGQLVPDQLPALATQFGPEWQQQQLGRLTPAARTDATVKLLQSGLPLSTEALDLTLSGLLEESSSGGAVSGDDLMAVSAPFLIFVDLQRSKTLHFAVHAP